MRKPLVSEYVVEVAYTDFYIDTDLCVQEAGRITFASPLRAEAPFFERRGEGKRG